MWWAVATGVTVLHAGLFAGAAGAAASSSAPEAFRPGPMTVRTLAPAEPVLLDAPPVTAPPRAAPARPARVLPKAQHPVPEVKAEPLQLALADTSSTPAAGPARAALAAPAADVPVYRTRMPPPITLEYDMRKGSWSGSGELVWRPTGARYQAKLEGRVAGFKVMTWASEGGLDTAGVAPVRFTDQRRGKSMMAANFQRQSGRITFSGPSSEFALVPGSQDRLSWMVQIAAIAAADPQKVASAQRVSFFVAGARGDADVWSFQSQGTEDVMAGGGTVQAVRLLREPRKPNDTRVEVWLDPKQHYLPVRARLTSDGDTLELLLRETHPPS
ncbi:MAG: hypothetical protein RLZZ618_2843 [Pseudomonadota bacterium]|jgi:hypothetical protein